MHCTIHCTPRSSSDAQQRRAIQWLPHPTKVKDFPLLYVHLACQPARYTTTQGLLSHWPSLGAPRRRQQCQPGGIRYQWCAHCPSPCTLPQAAAQPAWRNPIPSSPCTFPQVAAQPAWRNPIPPPPALTALPPCTPCRRQRSQFDRVRNQRWRCGRHRRQAAGAQVSLFLVYHGSLAQHYGRSQKRTPLPPTSLSPQPQP